MPNNASQERPSRNVIGTDAAVAAELDHIEDRRRSAQFAYNTKVPAGETLGSRASRLQLAALCLSGGGIRSAAFCLGVLQSLACRRLLNSFDYLSTVSGGGFIGGWLQVLIREAGDIDRAQAELERNESDSLCRLRGFTNYLTPRGGPFSADTWAAIVLYLRNLLLNWMVFTPAFLLLALLGIFYRTFLASLILYPTAVLVLLVLATIALTYGSWRACCLIPSHRAAPLAYAASQEITRQIAVPSLIWAFIAPAVIDHGIKAPADTAWILSPWYIPACYAAAMLAGYGIAWLRPADRDEDANALYRDNSIRWLAATVCGTILTVIAIALIKPGAVLYEAAKFSPFDNKTSLLVDAATALATFGPIWFMGTHVLQTVFYVAFRKEAREADLDREWLGRLNGKLLLIGSVWTAFALVCLVAPVILLWAPAGDAVKNWNAGKIALWGSGTTIAGAVGAWLGKKVFSSVQSYVADSKRWSQWLPIALATIFAIGVLACCSSLLQWGLGKIGGYVTHLAPQDTVLFLLLGLQLCTGAALFLLMYFFGRVNVNRYSMHAIYRNRLARAFLGSARRHANRRPDPFTGFDPGDNPHFVDFAEWVSGQRLFPVVNMTMNVTSSNNNALAERKAESFYATPLVCGSAALGPKGKPEDSPQPPGAFVPTRLFAGMESLGNKKGRCKGPHFGSLLTISGATLSPNWGYHSSKVTAFLMTLFNVRLGAWLPNPANASADELQLSKPANSVAALFSELLGETTDDSQAVYLSDGGHFENLGLYEMLRRRCRQIIVVDAGQDPDGTFYDLGNAIRKARIDLDVEVKMSSIRIFSRKIIAADKSLDAQAIGIALGTIVYPDADPGDLLYLKPSYLSTIPADVRAYGRSDEDFPHDSAMQQWFTESQFESYRALGRWQMDQVKGATLDDLFKPPPT